MKTLAIFMVAFAAFVFAQSREQGTFGSLSASISVNFTVSAKTATSVARSNVDGVFHGLRNYFDVSYYPRWRHSKWDLSLNSITGYGLGVGCTRLIEFNVSTFPKECLDLFKSFLIDLHSQIS